MMSRLRDSHYRKQFVVVLWGLWRINLCWLFNAKSIFYLNNQFYFKEFS